MTLVQLEAKMRRLWAKSPRPGDESGQSLFDHTRDVVRQTRDYYSLYQPTWPILNENVCLPRIMAYAALLHDFGKVHVDFQAALCRGGRPFRNRHEILSLAFIEWLEVPVEERSWLEAAVALHHRTLARLIGPNMPFYLGEKFGAPGSPADHLVKGVRTEDAELLHLLVSAGYDLFSAADWPVFQLYGIRAFQAPAVESLRESLQRISALTPRFEAVEDEWSTRSHSPPWPERLAGILVRGIILSADHLGSFGRRELQVGLETVESVSRKLTRLREFRSHQNQLANLTGSAILVAPTGSGKTEAGLLWAARQSESAHLRGRTVLLLPYRASMNTMQGRLVGYFAPHLLDQPERWDEAVALVHGRSLPVAYERLLDRGYNAKDASRLAVLQADLARLNAAPLRVCSPFQLIRLLFSPNGVEALMLALKDSRLIFDEIHAYTPEHTALAMAATSFLTENLGSSALFMSATIPSHLRDALTTAFGDLPVVRPGDDVMARPVRHHLNLLDFDVLSGRARERLHIEAKNKSVLVVVNQVGRAISLFKGIAGSVPSVHLLHSRFTARDRFLKELELKPQPGKVLIATQAVEVSLDLDYDVCFSELAPMESLLQRFGRCNREGRQAERAPVYVFSIFPSQHRAGHLPYRKDHLDETLKVLEELVKEGGLIAEVSVQDLVDKSYPAELRHELAAQIRDKVSKIRSLFIDEFRPFGTADASQLHCLAREWERLFDGEEVLPECLRQKAATEESWLGRCRYFVPLSGGRFRSGLRDRPAGAEGRIDWDSDLLAFVIQAPYTDKFGLEVP